jgi:hypothetical protein
VLNSVNKHTVLGETGLIDLNKAYDENKDNKPLLWFPMAIDSLDDFTADNISASTGPGRSSLGQFQSYPRCGNETCSVLR